jgi:hypothetical protein
MAPSGAPARLQRDQLDGVLDNLGTLRKFLVGIVQIRNDSVFEIGFKKMVGQSGRRREMEDFVRYRAMESLCRQSAVFHPLDSWRLLAQAEMWHHKALDIASRAVERPDIPPVVVRAQSASLSHARDGIRLPPD